VRLTAIFLSACLVSGCGIVRIGEQNFIMPDRADTPARPRFDLVPRFPATLQDETIATPDGALLRGLSVRRPGATTAVLYLGGNMFHLDVHGRDVLPLLAACGTDVVVFDYRGYGRSSGAPTVATMLADAVRMYDHVSAQYPGGVVLHGQSLGSFMAAHVARERPALRALVLEASASNVPDWVGAVMPWYAKPFVSVDQTLAGIDSVKAVSGYRGRSLVLAGTRDTITPVALGRKVFDALPGPDKQWLQVDADHNDIFSDTQVVRPYCAFVNR
jgi:pimeloyl-ACP methyl ester carboxylesterase